MNNPFLWHAIHGNAISALALGLDAVIQSTVLLGAGLIAAGIVRRRSAAVQSVILRATLVAVLVCPMASWLLGGAGSGFRVNLPILPSANAIAPRVDIAKPVDISATTPIEPIAAAPAQRPLPILHASIFLGAAAGAISLLLLLRLALAVRMVRRVRNESRSASCNWIEDAGRCARVIGVTTPPVLQTASFNTPCLIGCQHPVILLPIGAKDVRHDVLVHELAHLRRHDCRWHLLSHVARALLWFQPLMWILSRRIEQSADEVCDDFVVAYGSNRAEYARALVDMAERCQLTWMGSGAALGMSGFKSSVARRVVRIMNHSRNISIASRRMTVVVVLALAAGATMLTGLLGTSIPADAADAASQAPARLAVPDAGAQSKKEKVIRDVFGNYAAASAAERGATAVKMLEQAEATRDDPVARYMLLKDAADLAAGTGDAITAIKAAGLLSNAYAVEGGELKLLLLRKCAGTGSTPTAAKAVADTGLLIANDAAAEGNFDLAVRMMSATETAARNAKNITLLLSIQTRAAELRWMQQEGAKAKVADDRLARNPNDADANLTRGRYLCLIRHDWTNGLPALAKGSNPAMKEAADADMANSAHSNRQVAAGDLWWDLAEKEPSGPQLAMRRRAAYWYAQAMSDAGFTGLKRTLLEKRVSQVPPPPARETVVSAPIPPTPAPTPSPAAPIPATPQSISAGPANRSVLLFPGHAQEIEVFSAIANKNVRIVNKESLQSVLGEADPFGNVSIVVFGGNAFHNTPGALFTVQVQARMRQFVENGGDLITFGNGEPRDRTEFFTKLFGIRNIGGPQTGAVSELADLRVHLDADKLSGGYLRKFIFTNGYEVPASANVLVRAGHDSNDVPVAGILPIGKGRVIFLGSSMANGDRPFVDSFFRFIYPDKPSSTASPRPGTAAGGTDLLAAVNLSTDVVDGKWTRGADGITIPAGNRMNRIHLPYVPPAEYDLSIAFTLHEEKGAIGILLAHNDASCIWLINHDACWFRATGDPAHVMPENVTPFSPKLTIGTKHEALIKVRNNSIATFIDGKPMSQLTEDYSQCRLEPFWSIGSHAIGLSGRDGATFHSVEATAASSSPSESVVAESVSAETVATLTAHLNDPTRWHIQKGNWQNSPGKFRGDGDSEIWSENLPPSGFMLTFTMNVINGNEPRMDFFGAGIRINNLGGGQNLFPVLSPTAVLTTPRVGIPIINNQPRLMTLKFYGDRFEVEVDHKPTLAGTFKSGPSIRLQFHGGAPTVGGTTEFSNFRVEPLTSAHGGVTSNSTDHSSSPSNILKTMSLRGKGITLPDGSIQMPNGQLDSRDRYAVPFRADFVAKTDSKNIRLSYGRGQIIFKWEGTPDAKQLRFTDPLKGPDRVLGFDGKGDVPVDLFVKITWIVEEKSTRVLVDGEERIKVDGDYAGLSDRLSIYPQHGSVVTVKSFSVSTPSGPGDSIFSDGPDTAPTSNRVLIFTGNHKELPIFSAISGDVHVVGNADTAKALADPQLFTSNKTIVWGPNRLGDLPGGMIDNATEYKLRHFVQDGGNLVVFEQYRPNNFDLLDRSFGITRDERGGPYGIASLAPDLAARVQAAGIGDDALKAIRFSKAFAVPNKSEILIRGGKKGDMIIAAAVPYGKGRVIVIGASMEGHDEQFDAIFFEYLYHSKPQGSIGVSPQSAVVSEKMKAFAAQRNALPAARQIADTLAKLKEWNGGNEIQANINTASDGTLHVDIRNQDALINIEALYGLKVSHLNLDTCRNLKSLNGLQGMPLTELNLTNCFALAGDLSALSGMPLTTLGLRDCKMLQSLNGLKGLPLTGDLNMDNCFALEGDLSSLQGMRLTKIHLRNCKKLQRLNGIGGLPLTELDLTNCFALTGDLSALAGMHLTKLSLFGCQNLQSLNGIQGMPLTGELNLAHCHSLEGDLSVLKGMQLTRLDLYECFKLKSLDGIQGMPLTELNLTDCQSLEGDLSALSGMPLKRLDLYMCQKVSSLAGLEGAPLKDLELTRRLYQANASTVFQRFPLLESLKTGDTKSDQEVAAMLKTRKPAADGSGFTDNAGPRKILMFFDSKRSEKIFKPIGGGNVAMVPTAGITQSLTDPATFSNFNLIVFEPNRFCDAPAGTYDDAAFARLGQYVENGGDLIIFEQMNNSNWDRIEHTFGIRKSARGSNKFANFAPELAPIVQASGLSDADIKKIDFAHCIDIPANATPLVRNKENGALVAIVPHGKGRLIVTGASLGGHDEEFDAVLFNYIYHYKQGAAIPPKPAPGDSIISDNTPGGNNVLLFQGNGNQREETLFTGIGGTVHIVKMEDTAAVLENTAALAKSNTIVFGVNRLCNTPIGDISNAARESLHRFVENGGDLVLFEQSRPNNWDVIEKSFGITQRGGPFNGATATSLDLIARTQSAGLTDDYMKKAVTANSYTVPENSTVLLRAGADAKMIVAAVVPVGKGRLILIGAHVTPEIEPLDRVILESIYRRPKSGSSAAPTPTPGAAPAAKTDGPSAVTPAQAATGGIGDSIFGDAGAAGAPVYLCDAKAAITHTGGNLPLYKGSEAYGHKVSVNGKEFTHALGVFPSMSSVSTVTYNLGGKFRTFRTGVGILDAANAPPTLQFSVKGDGKTLWSSQDMKQGQPPKQCVVDVTGVKDLQLIVWCGKITKDGEAVWLDPQVSS